MLGFLLTLPPFKTSSKNPSIFLAVFWLIIFSDTSSNLSKLLKSISPSKDLGLIVVASSTFSASCFLLVLNFFTASSLFFIFSVFKLFYLPLTAKLNNESKLTPIIPPSIAILNLALSSES